MQYTCTYISLVSNVHIMTNMASPVRLPFMHSMLKALTWPVTGASTCYCHETDKISALLVHYAACGGIYLPAFRIFKGQDGP